MAKIALEVERAVAQRIRSGSAARTEARIIHKGRGWTVGDVLCTCGPRDPIFEEAHSQFSLAIVAAGSFQYRSSGGRVLMSTGSVLLGTPGQCYECGHEHAAGDRCLSFWYAPEYLERIAADAGWRGPLRFRALRVPPVRPLSAVVARATAGLVASEAVPWEELAVALAGSVVEWTMGRRAPRAAAPVSAEARVTRALRTIDREAAPAGRELSLAELSDEAGVSPFHFLRMFEQITELTPHQYVRRTRLRAAAARIVSGREKILDVALDTGFGDVSNFNRAFKAEFGMTPNGIRKSPVVSRQPERTDDQQPLSIIAPANSAATRS